MKRVNTSILGLGICASLLLLVASAQTGKGDAEAGKGVFKAKCAECHNADSKEVKEGPGLMGVKNGKLPSGKSATHDAILELLNKGQDAMPAFKDVLSDQQREDVTAYVLTL